MKTTLATRFTGIDFENPFMLASAPPTESDSNIMRAFEAGWGGVVVKTIGMHPVINVKGPKTKFLRSTPNSYRLSMEKRPETALHSSWNWELISDKPLDWWLPRLRRIKDAFPHKVLVASIMAGSEDDREVNHWRELAVACQEQGVDAFELNLSCPHMDRVDMGSNIGKNVQLIDTVVRAVKEVARKPVWEKLTPTTTNIAKEAEAAFAGADAISSSNTFRRCRRLTRRRSSSRSTSTATSRMAASGTGDLPALARQDGADDDGVPGRSFRRSADFRLLAGPKLLLWGAAPRRSAGRDARPRDRTNVIKGCWQAWRRSSRSRRQGLASLDDIRGLRRDRIVAHHEIETPTRRILAARTP
jgi:dihydroorotate dehydrogenase